MSKSNIGAGIVAILLPAFIVLFNACGKESPATVSTASVSVISDTEAQCGGHVRDDGNCYVVQKGVCWSEHSNPTVPDNSFTNDGEGEGEFVSSITGFRIGTTYYVRAYAINSKGISYGEEKSFTIDFDYAKVTTNAVSNISTTSATCGGNVISIGNSPVTAKGICYDTSTNPTIYDKKTNDGSGIGSFTSSISYLTAGTKYYVRAYATNSKGTSYGEEKSFTTGIPAGSVIINGVRWATRNINQPGTFAANPEDAGKFYQWNRSKAWTATTGSLSGWNSSNPTGTEWTKANDPSPTGYRVPTFAEIETLLDETKVSNEWTTLNGVNGRQFTDKANGNSIFLPAAGHLSNNSGALSFAGIYGYYWSSTRSGSGYAYRLDFNHNYADWGTGGGSYGHSIRPVVE